MSEWRPGGWGNPWGETLALSPDKQTQYLLDNIFENGADTMLATLMEGGVYGQYTAGIDEGPWIVGDDGTYFDIADVVSDENKKGYLVFIPDKE